ncbi:hypothetical protein ACFYKX_11110 [Cytobacillus sp. FJAT-54145]|uniref:Uncharacterized protein n=1 Tax=Cytobacillus spartinae TaxID=3299023 RepID=A0ABW6KA96_9BACI
MKKSWFLSLLVLLLFLPALQPEAAKSKTVKETAFLVGITQAKNKVSVKADYIQWFMGEEANREAGKDKNCPIVNGKCETPDGYYMRNVNPKLRTLSVSPNVKIYMQTYNIEQTREIQWDQKITLKQFIDVMKKDKRYHDIPFHLEIQNGVIVKITEQYLP